MTERPENLISVTVSDGKYTIQQTGPGAWQALRYGEYWPGMERSGGPDNLHTALAYEIARLRVALSKVNDIRNGIIGCQTINWSEHIYPLVAALEEAGIKGQEYPEARAYMGTTLERTVSAENAVIAKDVEIARLREALSVIADVDDDGFTSDGHERASEWAARALQVTA